MFPKMVLALGFAVMAIGCANAAVLTADGSSAAKGLVNGIAKAAIGPDTLNYLAGGSGAGQTYVQTAGQPLAFGDAPFAAAPPAGVIQFPVALGAIAIYMNTGITTPKLLSTKSICTIFTGKATTWNKIDKSLPAVAVKVVRRSDSSGSSTVLDAYLKKVCGGTGLVAIGGANVVGADGTSGLMAAIVATKGSIGYASCGQSVGGTKEIAIQNKFKNAGGVTCKGASRYTSLTVKPPAGATPWASSWAAVSVLDGAKSGNYPISFIEYAYARKDDTAGTAAQKLQGYLAKKFLQYMTKSSGQAQFANYFFYPLPANLRTIACKAVNSLKVSPTLTNVASCPNKN